MITETTTERGRTVLKVETEQEFEQAFGRALDDQSIDIDAPRSSAKPMDSTTRPKSTACWTRPTEGDFQPSRRDHCGGSDPPRGRGKGWPKACPPLT